MGKQRKRMILLLLLQIKTQPHLGCCLAAATAAASAIFMHLCTNSAAPYVARTTCIGHGTMLYESERLAIAFSLICSICRMLVSVEGFAIIDPGNLGTCMLCTDDGCIGCIELGKPGTESYRAMLLGRTAMLLGRTAICQEEHVHVIAPSRQSVYTCITLLVLQAISFSCARCTRLLKRLEVISVLLLY
jgi:hypothetical protein